ncbi:MAG TPA: branched-chain amino acid ABC transporter permease [Syntrophobacteria bacterium]|nr:branched-chain amino acid ABC transporter permease [Syntrophobacteria bacterium]
MKKTHCSGQTLVALALALALVIFPFIVSSPVTRNLMILIFLYAGLAQAWNIVGGFAGQVSLGNAIFFAVGGYTSTLLLQHAALSPWVGAIAGAMLAMILALVVGWPVFRLGGHYFAIATIAIGEIALALMANWEAVGGARGLTIPFVRDSSGRPADTWVWFQFNQNKLPYYFIALALMFTLAGLTAWLDRNKPGFYFRAIKNDQDAARSLGVNVLRYKLLAFVLSAAFTALLGTLYAQYLLFIDPESTLALRLSVLIALVAILGGVGTVWGPILGSFVLIPLGELSRAHLGGSGRAVDLIIYGALIVLISVFQPAGLMGLGRRLRGK